MESVHTDTDAEEPYLENIPKDTIVFTFYWNTVVTNNYRLPKETVSSIRDAYNYTIRLC